MLMSTSSIVYDMPSDRFHPPPPQSLMLEAKREGSTMYCCVSIAKLLYASKELLTSNDVNVLGTVCEPFCTVESAPFLQDDMPAVDLLRYYVGFVGDVGPTEEDILWPNQVLHRDRILFNVRSGEDIARFLSSPNLEAVLEHGENLRRIALERGYHMGWCWQMLRLRWGGATLADLKLRKADFV
ncbi:hypothetical protein APUTEX25_004783 [Auxenochlorella protothecoides]|uniref:Uncharacterized protein n=1 Tax=Auxenochlorella protothecoides TaxID=3075 RepID=A0A3M7KUB5_AUXPR|nr:hypothetical protein APUTEX25_004783 [Auxenochlorella protothecoides]|eukprot:RMZ53295.1 hypothetical protein APUTEX25_004783 [Auxenochlorella protothecoides]